MSTSVHPYTVGLAAASAGIITLGLVSAPLPTVDAAVSRTEVHAVQLAAVTSAQISAAVVNTAALASAVTPPSPTHTAAATTPPASPVVHPTPTSAETTTPTPAQLIQGIITNFALGTLFVVGSPLWYLAAPLTFTLAAFISAFPGWPIGQNVALAWLTLPFDAALGYFRYAAEDLQQLFAPPTAAASASSTNPVIHPAATVAGPRPGANAKTRPHATAGVTPKPATATNTRAALALPTVSRVDAKNTTPTAAARPTTTTKAAAPAASTRGGTTKTASAAARVGHKS
jgi:hypothetical protein